MVNVFITLPNGLEDEWHFNEECGTHFTRVLITKGDFICYM